MPARAAAALLALVAVLAGGPGGVQPVDAQVPARWAPVERARIHPGVMVFVDGAQCTANFVFTDGTDTYLGIAAHCATAGRSMRTNGCVADPLPLGTEVVVAGAEHPARLAYSSWSAMQTHRERRPNACRANDFALVRLHPDDARQTNPTVPHWGGPDGLRYDPTAPLEPLHGYGNSLLRLGLGVLTPKTGVALGSGSGGWSHPAYLVTPGIPGDSGGALLDAQGRATGVLSTITLWPLTLSNNYTDLNRAMLYMWDHGGPRATLALGTEPFDGAQLPLG